MTVVGCSVWGCPLLQGLPCLGSGGTCICQGCLPDVMWLQTAGKGGQVVSAWQVGWVGQVYRRTPGQSELVSAQ